MEKEIEIWKSWNKTNKKLTAYKDLVEKLKVSMYEIAYPIKAMQKRADELGANIDGQMAIRLSNDPHHLSTIAKHSLQTITDFNKSVGKVKDDN